MFKAEVLAGLLSMIIHWLAYVTNSKTVNFTLAERIFMQLCIAIPLTGLPVCVFKYTE